MATADARGAYVLDTSAATVTVTLPDGESRGGRTIGPFKRMGANTAVFHPSGTNKIDGNNADYALTSDGSAVSFTWVGGAVGWMSRIEGGAVTVNGSGSTAPGDISVIAADSAPQIDPATGEDYLAVSFVVAAPVSGEAPEVIHYWNIVPDPGSQTLLADGTQAWDGTVAASGHADPQYLGFAWWNGAQSQTVSFRIPAVSQDQYGRVYAASGKHDYIPRIVPYGQPGATPSRQYTARARTRQSGTEYAQNVQAFGTSPSGDPASDVKVTRAESGDQFWSVGLKWLWPSGRTADGGSARGSYAGAHLALTLGDIVIVLEDANGAREPIGIVSASSLPAFQTRTLPVPPGTSAWTFWAVSRDAKGNANAIVPGVTPSVRVSVTRQSGAEGSEYVPNATGVSMAIDPYADTSGTRFLRLVVSGTDPDRNVHPEFGGYHVKLQVAAGNVVTVGAARLLPIRIDLRKPATSESWTVSLVSIDVNNRENSIVVGTTPQQAFTVGGGTDLDLTKVDGTTFNGNFFRKNPTTSVFEIVPNSIGATEIQDGSITTPKLTTGQVLIGGGGGKPTKLQINDGLNSPIGWFGDDTGGSGRIGGWAKQFYIGGTGPADAPLKADAYGNVSISGATFALTASGGFIVEISPSRSIYLYSGATSYTQIQNGLIDMETGSGSCRAWPGGISIWTPSGYLELSGSSSSGSPGTDPAGYFMAAISAGGNGPTPSSKTWVKIPYYT